MALSTYSDMQTALASWLDGSDFSGRETDFIALTEDEINARLATGIEQGRKIRPMMQSDPLTIDAEYVDMPDGETVSVISIEVEGLDRPWIVKHISAESLVAMRMGQEEERSSILAEIGANPPRYYALVGDQLRFFPEPETSFTAVIQRYVKIPALSDDVTSNWVLASHRNAYLYGALAQAEMFGWEARGTAAKWTELFANACDGIIARYPVLSDMTPLRTDMVPRGGYSYASFMAGT